MTSKFWSAALISGALIGSCFAQAADTVPAYIQAAVASTRPEADTVRDINRKPAEVLAFAGLKPGDKIGELMPGRGYYTNLFCKVVGEQGHIHTVSFSRVTPPGAAPAAPPANRPPPPPPACSNITPASQLIADFALPAGLDMVWTSENYHDFLNPGFGVPDMARFNKRVFDALKPGGIYIVEDHSAAAGAGASVADSLHRIEPEFVKQQVISAGFVLEAESNLLRNADDQRTGRAHQMEGKSDKFLFKFRKPAR